MSEGNIEFLTTRISRVSCFAVFCIGVKICFAIRGFRPANHAYHAFLVNHGATQRPRVPSRPTRDPFFNDTFPFNSSLNSSLFAVHATCCHYINTRNTGSYIDKMKSFQVVCLNTPSLIPIDSQEDAFRDLRAAYPLGLCGCLHCTAVETISASDLWSRFSL